MPGFERHESRLLAGASLLLLGLAAPAFAQTGSATADVRTWLHDHDAGHYNIGADDVFLF